MVSYFCLEILRELVDAGDAAGFHHLFVCRAGAGEGDVFLNGAVEQESILQDHSQLRAIGAEAHGGEIDSVDGDDAAVGIMERGDQADDGRFTGAGGADQRGYGSRLGLETDVVQDLLGRVVREVHVVENDLAVDRGYRDGSVGILRFRSLGENFMSAIQAGEGLGQLRSDVHHLGDWSDEKREAGDEQHQVAEGHSAREDLAGSDVPDNGADDSHHHRGRQAHERGRGEGLQNIVEQALDAAGKHLGFARFGMIALHDAHAAERFGEASGDLGVDLAALPENRADFRERLFHHEGKRERGRSR